MTGAVLHGFRFSVYVRAARLALEERGQPYELIEVNPFEPDSARTNPHPMNRVPVLDHGGARIHETAAILSYVAAAFPGPSLLPEAPLARVRMVQVQGIADAYGYWPLVRQVYSARVFDPALGRPLDTDAIAEGMRAAAPVLAMLEEVATEGLVLSGATMTLADLHLAPMIAAFTAAPEGAAALSEHPMLTEWWHAIRTRDSLARTDPGLPGR